MKNIKKLSLILLSLLLLFSLFSCTNAQNVSDTGVPTGTQDLRSSFSVRFIDVGQADSALVCCDGRNMLIDGGNVADSDIIYSVLKKENIEKLDIVVGTHAHEDHIGGLSAAYRASEVALTLCPVKDYSSDAFGAFAKSASAFGGITVPSVNDEYTLGSAKIKILGVNCGDETNDTSIVLKITYGKTTFLFTGDAERETENAIIDSGADLSSTVLKVGHHGSESSSSYLFLRNIMPEYAVISVGKDNSYGHPSDAVLSRLRDAGVTVYRTDLMGDILCESDGENITFTVSKNEDAVSFAQNESKKEEYIGNKNSKKFHLPSCSGASSIASDNRYYYTGTREGILSLGYSPCGICKP